MTSKKKINYITELQEIQRLAVESPKAVELRSEDGHMIVDAKSYIGMYALDFTRPIHIVSDDAEYHEKIRNIGENID
ncbi:hypothetical protein LJC49_02605 [Ruminococcaceae bacterium OttesenSCG-928-I18]|nr:hypothetical protein [Ruminococcaceae bacterium OttesenSCG-928-I18]